MVKIGKKTSEPQNEADSRQKEVGNSWFKNNQRSIMAVALIAVMAFVMRFVFAYGTSADSGFALSGGTSASEHLSTITSIVNGTFVFGVDGGTFYPFGTANTNPVLIDFVIALFAMIGKACGMSAVSASAAALSWFSVIFGTLSVVAMFFLGKEVVGTKKAGYLAAVFLAFCPIVISQTVFSNGTEVAVYGFLAIIFFMFVYKGLKALDRNTSDKSFGDMFKANKTAMKDSIIAGIFLAVIAYSWNGFRSLVAILIIAMVIMMVIDRLKGKDVRATVAFYSIAILIGVLAALPYYIVAGLWDLVFSGTFILAAIWVVVGVAFAFLQKKPWIVTVPAFAIVLIAAFIAIAVAAPSLFGQIFSGNSYLGAAFDGITGSTFSISNMATYFGYVTMWFGIIVFAVMLFRIPKHISSPVYIFTMVFILMGTYYSTKSNELAVVFAPVFALAFAYVLMWLFDNVDFKTYFVSMKNADIRTIWKKVLKPIPFISIVGVVLLICIPNAFYAIDAGIPTNDGDKYSGLDTGAAGYYIKTDSDWKVNDVLSDYRDVQKNGALVTWADYGSDARAFGGFDIIADTNGNGAEAVSNILLANGTNGSSTAAMIIYLLKYTGFGDDVKTALVGAGMDAADFDEMKKIVETPADYRSKVIKDMAKYGELRTNVSDENISYVYGKDFLSSSYSSFDLSKMFEVLEEKSGKNISYFMIAGNMFPIYFGYVSTFSTMAYTNGYAITDAYGTVGEFLKADYFTMYYTGFYNYTESMYDTLMWRMYIGMSPEEAGFSGMLGPYNYLSGLMLSDGTYKVQPGYGLSNYAVDYDTWYVMYNADSNATGTSDGWNKMLYTDAIALQENNGGLINYLSGLPVFFNYVATSDGHAVSGTVTHASENIAGIRVSVIDSKGAVCSTDFTDDQGQYKVFVTDVNSKISFYAGSTTLNDGVLIKTVDYTDGLSTQDVEVQASKFTGKIVNEDGELVSEMDLIVKLEGKVSKKTVTSPVVTPGMTFEFTDLVPDQYVITVTSADGKTVYTEDDQSKNTYVMQIGDNLGYNIKLKTYVVTLTVNDKDTTSYVKPGTAVDLNSTDGASFNGTVGDNGKVEISVVKGTYFCNVDGYVTLSDTFDISNSTSKTVSVIAGKSYLVTGLPANAVVSVNGTGSRAMGLSEDTGEALLTLPVGTAFGAVFTCYAYDSQYVYTATIDTSSTADVAAVQHNAFKISGILKDSTGSAKSGTVMFTDEDGIQITVAADSEGKYSATLFNGKFSVYAVSGNDVLIIDEIEMTADVADKELALGAGTPITLSTYWYSSSYYLAYQMFEIYDIRDDTITYGETFKVMSGSDGTVKFVIPSGMKCSVKAILPDSGNVYYKGEGDTKNYFKINDNVTGSVSFDATFDKISVQNLTGYEMKFGKDSTVIAAGATQEIELSSRIASVSIDYVYDGNAYNYYSGSMYLKPVPAGESLVVTPQMVKAKPYQKVTVTCEDASNVVKIEALDEGSYNNKDTTAAEKVYYLEDHHRFIITVTDKDDATKIWYTNLVPVTEENVTAELKEFATIRGFVGVTEKGTLSVGSPSWVGWTLDKTISSGSFSDIKLPVGTEYVLTAKTYLGDDDVSYRYESTRTIAADELAAGKTYVYNLAVTDSPSYVPDPMDVSATADIIAAGEAAEKRSVTVSITAKTPSITEDTTYLLSGGSDWFDIQFYSDSGLTEQITAITLNGTDKTFYAKGTIVASKVAVGSKDFSIDFKSTSGDDCGSAVVTDSASKIAATEYKVSKVNFGKDVAGNGEYKYAIELVNEDNYTKDFLIKVDDDANLMTKWIITVVQGDNIYPYSSAGVPVSIVGYKTETVFIKFTSSITDPAEPVVTGTIKSTVEVTTAGETLDSDYLNDGITIAGTKATVTSLTFTTMIEVTESGASGRGVYNDQGSMPMYIWVLIGILVLLLLGMIWIASKRGVFRRKK